MSLPAGWVEYPDPATGNPYYHHAGRGETTWTRPAPEVAQFVQQPQVQMQQQPPMQMQQQPLPAGWVEYQDASTGNPYYHCAANNETTWTRPAGFGAPMGGALPQGYISGTCKNWDEEKGFGFIDPIGGGDNVFVHRSALVDGSMLVKGAAVQYELTFNPQKGKAQVSKCIGAIGVAGATPGQPPAAAFVPAASPTQDGIESSGVVKTWFDDKGFGFVTPADGSKDCYVHRTFVLDGQSLIVGSTVNYTGQYDPVKNKMNATKVTGGVPGNDDGKGGGKGMAPMGAPMGGFAPVMNTGLQNMGQAGPYGGFAAGQV